MQQNPSHMELDRLSRSLVFTCEERAHLRKGFLKAHLLENLSILSPLARRKVPSQAISHSKPALEIHHRFLRRAASILCFTWLAGHLFSFSKKQYLLYIFGVNY